MRKIIKITKMKILLFTVFVLVAQSRVMPQSTEGSRPSTWELIRKSQKKKSEAAKPVVIERVVRFLKDRSLGRLMIQDSNLVRDINTFHYWTEAGDSEWEYFAEAQGDVKVLKGKRLSLFVDRNAWKDLSSLKNLGPGDLHELGFVHMEDNDTGLPDDRCMPYISHLTGLKILRLSNTNISAEGLKLIGNLSSLERLYTPRGFTDAGLAGVTNLSSLKALYIRNHSLTNDGLAHLARLELLEELDLVGKGRLNDGGLVHLTKLPRLQYLLLSGKNFTDAGMLHIKNCPSLRILHLGHLRQLTDAALIHLSKIPQLERVSFHWNENITNAGIVHLAKSKSLKMLDIKHSKVTDEGLAHLAKIKTLENLTLPDTGVTDASFEHIAQLQNLRYLWAGSRSSSPLTDKTLSIVGTLKNLEELSIGGTGFGDEGMKHIAKLTNLKELSIFTANQMTNRGLAELAKLKSLTNFSLGRRTNVSISGLNRLNSLKNLKSLRVSGIKQDDSTLDISELTDLQNLSLTLFSHRQGKNRIRVSDSFRNEDWACLANLKKLRRLQITGVGIDNEGVKYLSDLRNLEFLNIICPGESNITDDALEYMAEMHKLNRLYIKDGHFTDKALDYFYDLPSLTWLELTSDYAFSNRAIRDFQRKNPNITRLQLIP